MPLNWKTGFACAAAFAAMVVATPVSSSRATVNASVDGAGGGTGGVAAPANDTVQAGSGISSGGETTGSQTAGAGNRALRLRRERLVRIAKTSITVQNGSHVSTYRMDANTRIVIAIGPIRANETRPNWHSLRIGDWVTVNAKAGVAQTVLDYRHISGPILPLNQRN